MRVALLAGASGMLHLRLSTRTTQAPRISTPGYVIAATIDERAGIFMSRTHTFLGRREDATGRVVFRHTMWADG